MKNNSKMITGLTALSLLVGSAAFADATKSSASSTTTQAVQTHDGKAKEASHSTNSYQGLLHKIKSYFSEKGKSEKTAKN